jgi:hypothetical protein
MISASAKRACVGVGATCSTAEMACILVRANDVVLNVNKE